MRTPFVRFCSPAFPFLYSIVLLLSLIAHGLPPASADAAEPARPKYHSPQEVAFSPDGGLMAVTDRTGGTLVLIDVGSAQIRHTVPLSGEPAGVAWSPNGQTVYVTEYMAGSVAEVNVTDGHIVRRLAVDRHPQGVAVAPQRGMLVVANTTTNRVTVLDINTGQPAAQIAVPREPYYVAVTPDESLAIVTNLLPAGSATDPAYGAVVSLIDLEQLKHVADIALSPGASTVRQVCVTADGKWAYVTHCVGAHQRPFDSAGTWLGEH